MKKQAGNFKWTPAQDAVLREHFAADMRIADIADDINAQFHTRYSARSVSSRASNYLRLRRPGKRPATVWTEAMNATLIDGIDKCHTLTTIAQTMGLPYSAVNKQVHVLRIDIAQGKRQTAERISYLERREAQRREERRLNRLLNFVPGEYRVEGPLPTRPEVVTDPLNLPMAELGRYQCHWIMNDDLAAPLYCGHRVHEHTSWCPAHREVVKLEPT